MILEPDFLDHWKTRNLIRLLGDELAPLYLIRLWSHCQLRRTDRLKINSEELALICHFPLEKKASLVAAMKASRCIHEVKGGFIIHGFKEINGKLFANWNNGLKGGRPKKPNPELEKPVHSNLIYSNHSSSAVQKKKGDLKGKEEEGRRPRPKDEDEVVAYARTLSLPDSDGRYFWSKWVGNGFRNAGDKMQDWQGTIRAWKMAGYCPSQNRKTTPSSVEDWKRYDKAGRRVDQYGRYMDSNQIRQEDEFYQEEKERKNKA